MARLQHTRKLEALVILAGGDAEVFVALSADPPPLVPPARDMLEAPREPLSREAFFARRSLARRALAQRLQCASEDVTILRDGDGAPLVASPSCGLHVSLSSRGDLVAAAIASNPVGVDVEPIGAPFEIPANVLHPNERAALAAAPRAHERFLTIWTAKEAYLKALRTGLAREPVDIEVSFSGPELVVRDRGARVALAAGFAQILTYKRREFALACVVLAR